MFCEKLFWWGLFLSFFLSSLAIVRLLVCSRRLLNVLFVCRFRHLLVSRSFLMSHLFAFSLSLSLSLCVFF